MTKEAGWKKALKSMWKSQITAPLWLPPIWVSVYSIMGIIFWFINRDLWVALYGPFIIFYAYVFYKSRKWHRKENSKQVMARIKGER